MTALGSRPHILKSLFVIAVHVLGAQAFAGGQDSGGGNVYEAEFKLVASNLVREIEAAGVSEAQIGFSLADFKADIGQPGISSPQQVLVNAIAEPVRLENGTPRTAVNSKIERVILFNENIWSQLQDRQKRVIVMHEYMRFLGVDDSQYNYSARLLALVDKGDGGTDDSAQVYMIERWVS